MSSAATSRNGRTAVTSSTINPAGAADEDLFIRSFEDVPRIQISSANQLVSTMCECNKILEENGEDWERRVTCLKKIRSLISNGHSKQYANDFLSNLRAVPFEMSLKDLRSRVMNETAITIAYICQNFTSKVDRWIEELLPILFKCIQNSARFISTSAVVCIRFIIQFTHSSRLIPVICNHISEKSKPIRKAVCEFLDQLLHTWPVQCLERHQNLLGDTVKKGINDADPEARVFARKAFWGFFDHFRSQADTIMTSLDPQKQKLLYDQMGGALTASNSTNSIASFASSHSRPDGGKCFISHSGGISKFQSSRTRTSVSASSSIENLTRPWSSMSHAGTASSSRIPGVKSRIPVYSPKEASNGKLCQLVLNLLITLLV